MRKQTKLWTTRDGRRLRVCDMEDDHLLNTIRLLQRVAEGKRINTVAFYATCDPPTSDGALDCFNREYDGVMDATYEDFLSVPQNIYNSLMVEAERRGIEVPKQPHRIGLEVGAVATRLGITL